MRRPLLVLALLLLLPGGASAQDPGAALSTLQEKLQQDRAKEKASREAAEKLRREVADLQAALIRSAATVRGLEGQVAALEEEIEALGRRQEATAATLADSRRRLAASLAALRRLAAQPRQVPLFLAAGAPIDKARGAFLLGRIAPLLQARAAAFAAALAAQQADRAALESRRAALAETLRRLAAENVGLSALLERKAALAGESEATAKAKRREIAALARQARDLRELIARIDAARVESETAAAAPAAPAERVEQAAPRAAAQRRPADLRPFPGDGDGLLAPARGQVVTRFGARDDEGVAAKGAEIAVRAGARILAPFDGRIVFRGPFRSYGEILIIEHGGGYHTVLAGLGRIDVDLGQWVKAGEPLGAMIATGAGRPRLYLELRRDGQPIDPAPLLP